MEQNMARAMVEVVVKQAIKSIQDSPERGIRNLVDMALQFSEGSFQKTFFTITQTMLQNENSAYYDLVRETVTHTEPDRLYTFGMNVGYNSCTEGARRIRQYEETMNCNIPWTISLELDAQTFQAARASYDALIFEGEGLGIYTWMLFAPEAPREAITLANGHPDSAFCLFCQPGALSAAVLHEAANLDNLMLVVRYEERAAALCAALRERGLLYSVWYPYGQDDLEVIVSGALFRRAQELFPIFTILLPVENCPQEARRLAYQAVLSAREAQTYHTAVFEFEGDNGLIDSIISDDACSVCFDKHGDLYPGHKNEDSGPHNLFQSSLTHILTNVYPKKARNSV